MNLSSFWFHFNLVYLVDYIFSSTEGSIFGYLVWS